MGTKKDVNHKLYTLEHSYIDKIANGSNFITRIQNIVRDKVEKI